MIQKAIAPRTPNGHVNAAIEAAQRESFDTFNAAMWREQHAALSTKQQEAECERIRDILEREVRRGQPQRSALWAKARAIGMDVRDLERRWHAAVPKPALMNTQEAFR